MVARTQVFVVDASVAVKWYVEEEHREQALELRQDYYDGKVTLRSHALILYEVANALRYHPGLSADDVLNSLTSLLDMQLDLFQPTENAAKEIVDLAFNEDLTVYDAAYLALARLSAARLLTADETLYNKLGPEAKALVLLLKDYR